MMQRVRTLARHGSFLRRVTLVALWATVLPPLVVGCKRKGAPEQPAEPSDAPRPQTPDRLAPGALLEGDKVVFGWRVPRDLKLVARFPDAAHFVGRVKLADLEDYIRERVVMRHVEVTPTHSIFPNVRIRGGDPNRIYRFEIAPKLDSVELVVRDVTPPPPTVGLSEEERWRRAGLTPDGKLLNPNELE